MFKKGNCPCVIRPPCSGELCLVSVEARCARAGRFEAVLIEAGEGVSVTSTRACQRLFTHSSHPHVRQSGVADTTGTLSSSSLPPNGLPSWLFDRDACKREDCGGGTSIR